MSRYFTLLFVSFFTIAASAAPEWSDSLYLSGGGCWTGRIPIRIVNSGNSPAKGEAVRLTVGSAPGELPVAGVRAEGLRLSDANGTELLFDLERDGKEIRTGLLEPGTDLLVPAVADPGKTAEITLYYNNPAALELPEFLPERKPAPAGVKAVPGAPETLKLRQEAATQTGLSAADYPKRYPVTVRNLSRTPRENVLIHIDLAGLPLDDVSVKSLKLLRNGEPVRFLKLGSGLVFTETVPALTERTYHLYLHKNPETVKVTGEVRSGSDVLSDHVFVRKREKTDPAAYRRLLESAANIAPNPSFEKGADGKADGWTPNVESVDTSGIRYSTPRDSVFGKRAVQVDIERAGRWAGWRANVPVEAGKSYLFAAWMKGENVSPMRELYLHLRNTSIPGHVIYISSNGSGAGTYDWKTALLPFRVPAADGKWVMRANLVTDAKGKLTYDGVLIAETIPARLGDAEPNHPEKPNWQSWCVNPIVKVFRDALPPEEPVPASVSLARNEKEPMQLVLRHPAPGTGEVEIRVTPPRNEEGDTLPAPETGVVGFVPVDYPSEYYSTRVPPYVRAIPDGVGLGDGRFWPDPILPWGHFTPLPGKAQPVWITFHAPKTAKPGLYRGTVELVRADKVESRIPYEITVRDFTLPDSRKMQGLFTIWLPDIECNGKYQWDDLAGKKKAYLKIADFLHSRKLDTTGNHWWDYIGINRDPQTEKITCTFDRYDKLAEKILEEFQSDFFFIFPHTRFVFNQPPTPFLGLPPYAGKYPYKGADRSKLAPDYRKALFDSTRQIWEHIKEKGWQDKLYFYLADEPADNPEIIQQGAAMLDVLREAAPGMLIYCSTWRDIPEWHGKLNVWGIGVHGSMSPEAMAARRKAGDKLIFTLDGHMCIDTPYNAIERLLPYYCFKYDVEKYEFWGADFMQHDQFKFGFPKFNTSNPAPGVYRQTRYPNGDGYLLYNGRFIGYDGLVSSIRLENCRDGIDDFDYLSLLTELTAKTGDAEGKKLLEEAKSLVSIPNAGGRNSTALLPDPDRISRLRDRIAKRIEQLRQ